MTLLPFRITYVQSGPGVTTATPQQVTPAPGPAYLPSSLATLGFTAIAPAGQALVQPIVGQPPLLAPAPPMSSQSQQTPPGQASGSAGRQVNKTREPKMFRECGIMKTSPPSHEFLIQSLLQKTFCRREWRSRLKLAFGFYLVFILNTKTCKFKGPVSDSCTINFLSKSADILSWSAACVMFMKKICKQEVNNVTRTKPNSRSRFSSNNGCTIKRMKRMK